MAVGVGESAFVVGPAQAVALSAMISVTPSPSDPAYLVLTALDRDEYTGAATGATGSLSGNGSTLGFGAVGGDGRGAGTVFAYQAATGRYYSAALGYLDQLTYTASASLGDVTSLSVFGTDNPWLAVTYAADAVALMQLDPSGYLGSATVVTEPGFAGPVPAQATPGSIAAAAESFVGQAWNTDGCWVLASAIAAEAGASLPVQSTVIGIPGQGNGEWIVAYDGPAGQGGDWQSLVQAGEIVAFETGSGSGHITTCVSGSGSTAMLVDNITYVNAAGSVVNLANDGSAADVVVAAPHPASQEWAGVPSSSVVIYELDTPAVSARIAGFTVAPGATDGLGSLFSATDPAGRAIAAYQVYGTNAADALVVGGADQAARSAATAATVGSLSQVSFQAGAADGTDTLYVRAFNGAYWGDWTALGVCVVGQLAVSTVADAASAANFAWTDTTTGVAGGAAGDPYGGPVSYLRYQYLWSGGDSVNVTATAADVFMQGGPGNDALVASGGSNVLDGGAGSNFLVGAVGADGGADTFFLDGRGANATWDTLVNVHAGDALTLWGYVPGSATITWADGEGAAGYQGATLHASLASGATDSVTFAGMSLAQAQATLAVSSGTAGGIPYLYVRDAA